MKTLTVITTTYNRAYCLHQVYESLCRQTSDDFIWLVVDDGSSDNTKELVDNWILQNTIKIEYYYKPNGGMHTARNYAYEKVYTELNVIIDSDDWMTDNAVELIIDFWGKYKDEKYAGVVTNNISPQGKMIGSALPQGISSCTITDLFGKYRVKGDKKLIYRSELTRKYPYPEFEGEKFFPASYKFKLLDKDYTMLLMNEYTCVVDYNEDSMSNESSKIKQYRSCCKGFSFWRNEMMRISKSPKYIIQQMIHYIAERQFDKKSAIEECSKPIYAILCYPVGILYYRHLIRKLRKIDYD